MQLNKSCNTIPYTFSFLCSRASYEYIVPEVRNRDIINVDLAVTDFQIITSIINIIVNES